MLQPPRGGVDDDPRKIMDAELAEQAPLTPGQVLEGKYRVGKALGGGAMGIVYEAYHLLLQKAVAVKVLRPELAAVEDVRDRFEAEARAAAAIGHPNIVSVTDMGQTPVGALYFVMDRLRGETLGERLNRQGKLDVAPTVHIVLEVLSGLEAAHELRLVHRDLKPDNIFLARPPGGREIAKILDFGIAKALASVGKRNKGTRLGTTVGTPLYMAPEQAVADPDIDARADLYALGVILYQVLGGRPPFDGKDAVAVLAAAMSETPTPLASLCPAAPRELIELVGAAMSRDRDQRPASASEFARRLQSAVGITLTPAPVALAKAPAVDLSKLDGALGSAVLVDLDGKEVSAAEAVRGAKATIAYGARSPEDEVEEEEEYEEPAPVKAAPAPQAPAPQAHWAGRGETYVVPKRRRAGLLKWLLPVPVLAAAAFVAVPRLRGAHEGTKETAAAARPTVVVQFDVTPRGSQLFLDGSPIVSAEAALPTGEIHMVSASAPGYELTHQKFFVDKAKIVELRLPRTSRRH
jgi:tRNA A-37 threonylcarbamoyl transferase component Bud32